MGVLALIAQLASCTLYLISFKRIFPALHFSVTMAKLPMLKKVAGYGIHTLLAGVSTQSLEQSPSLIIGIFLPVEFVGYYLLPLRLLSYAAEAVTRVGTVVQPQTAELMVHGRLESVSRMAAYVNRYCFCLYLAFAMPVLLYGSE